MSHFAHLIKVQGRERCVQHCHRYTNVVVWVLLLIGLVPDHASFVKEVLVGQDEHAKEAAADGQDLHARYDFIVHEVAGEGGHEHLCHHDGDRHGHGAKQDGDHGRHYGRVPVERPQEQRFLQVNGQLVDLDEAGALAVLPRVDLGPQHDEQGPYEYDVGKFDVCGLVRHFLSGVHGAARESLHYAPEEAHEMRDGPLAVLGLVAAAIVVLALGRVLRRVALPGRVDAFEFASLQIMVVQAAVLSFVFMAAPWPFAIIIFFHL